MIQLSSLWIERGSRIRSMALETLNLETPSFHPTTLLTEKDIEKFFGSYPAVENEEEMFYWEVVAEILILFPEKRAEIFTKYANLDKFKKILLEPELSEKKDLNYLELLVYGRVICPEVFKEVHSKFFDDYQTIYRFYMDEAKLALGEGRLDNVLSTLGKVKQAYFAFGDEVRLSLDTMLDFYESSKTLLNANKHGYLVNVKLLFTDYTPDFNTLLSFKDTIDEARADSRSVTVLRCAFDVSFLACASFTIDRDGLHMYFSNPPVKSTALPPLPKRKAFSPKKR